MVQLRSRLGYVAYRPPLLRRPFREEISSCSLRYLATLSRYVISLRDLDTMQAAQPNIKEEFTTTLFERGNTRTCLRVIKCTNDQGVTSTKFGISEYWFCSSLDKWLPSKKHHVFLPIDRWSALTSFSNVIEGFGTPNQDVVGHSRAVGEPSVPAATVVVGEPVADGKRRRGRPPKRADESTTSSTTIVQGAGADTESAKKARIVVIIPKGTGSSKKCKESEVRGTGGLPSTRGAEAGNKRAIGDDDAVELAAANLAASELTSEATFG